VATRCCVWNCVEPRCSVKPWCLWEPRCSRGDLLEPGCSEPRCLLESMCDHWSHGAQGHGACWNLRVITVLAEASCSWMSTEVCVALGHEVGRRRQQQREHSVLYITFRPLFCERRLFSSSFIAEGGFLRHLV
jgi:hypothetical protein